MPVSSPLLSARCQFKLTAFVTDYGMTIEGTSWFKTSPDAYSRQQLVAESLQPEVAACRGVSGYANPCPITDGTCTSGSKVTHAPFVAVFLSVFVAALSTLSMLR